jgi:hypothetical protein
MNKYHTTECNREFVLEIRTKAWRQYGTEGWRFKLCLQHFCGCIIPITGNLTE